MPKFENNILGFIPKQDWLDMGFEVKRPNDPVDALFGDDKTDNITAAWNTIADEYQIPVMAQFHGFDTEARTTFRAPIDNHNIEKGLIKVKINQSERMRTLVRNGVQNDQMYDYVVNDGIRLADQVVTRSKVAKNELMATGKITIKENNLNLTVDYGVTDAQKNFVISFDDGADVPAQIQAIVDAALDKGTILTGIYTSKVNLTKMRKHASIQTAINGSASVGALVKIEALKAYLEEEFGITQVIDNDLRYGADAIIDSDGRPVVTQKRYYPENKITFFATNPAGKMGIGLWGNPPEEDAARFMDVNASSVNPYVFISQWMENDPAVLWTKASGLFIPVLYNPCALYIATVDDNSFSSDLTVTADATDASYPWTDKHPSDFQSSITVADGKVRGTLNFMEGGLSPDGPLAGDGYFLALKWSNPDTSKVTSLKVGLEPGHMAPQECIEDTDRNGVFKIENKDSQKVVLIQSDGTNMNKQSLDLSGLTLNSTGA